ncbi:protein CUSTOS-like [Colletes gigas]|uniref:protein CUSTOS-like n=1 Tax=Colletes gigas TaxID=935657 RepID=UPI001C9B7473|nr:protein CUSTOS-like [Colletes gigas]
MLNVNNEDSTSSEDEVSKDALREATDHHFFKNTYLSTTKSENTKISEKTNEDIRIENSTSIKSLRKNLDQEDHFENFGASPSFQNYVARKLDEVIEKSIKLKDKKKKSTSSTDDKESTDNSIGIKLLSSSVEFLTEKEEVEKPQKKRKIPATIDDKKNLVKCKEVAVDPKWILSKTDTKAWKSKRKEPEFKYKKLKNGTLVEDT